MIKSKLLLHVCCGTCGSWVPRKLSHDWDVDLYFFNPNIHPEEEYLRRLKGVRDMARELDLKLIEGVYDPKNWFEVVKGFANEPEGGARCDLCFRFRLGETARYARDHGYDAFATTLTVGRRKPVGTIHPIGHEMGTKYGTEFVGQDWKKGGGEDMSQLLAKEHGVYRQEYCGCVYSKSEHENKKTAS